VNECKPCLEVRVVLQLRNALLHVGVLQVGSSAGAGAAGSSRGGHRASAHICTSAPMPAAPENIKAHHVSTHTDTSDKQVVYTKQQIAFTSDTGLGLDVPRTAVRASRARRGRERVRVGGGRTEIMLFMAVICLATIGLPIIPCICFIWSCTFFAVSHSHGRYTNFSKHRTIALDATDEAAAAGALGRRPRWRGTRWRDAWWGRWGGRFTKCLRTC